MPLKPSGITGYSVHNLFLTCLNSPFGKKAYLRTVILSYTV